MRDSETIITVKVRMGRRGPVVTPNTANVPKNGKVQWVAEDDDRWWAIVMKNEKTPFPGKRSTFKGKSKPKGSRFKGSVKVGQEYKYWIIYHDEKGEPHLKDPKIVIKSIRR